MTLSTESGLWSTGITAVPAPLVAVLEVSGAVLSWTVDADVADPPVITFTDHLRADWLWRVLGEPGHVAVVDALTYRDPERAVELRSVAVQPGSTDALRRLAFGHWLRRWWPASERDGIAALDRAVLDAEIALLTVATEEFFTDDTLDADIADLLAPHAQTLNSAAAQSDPRIRALAQGCRELAEEAGLAGWAEPEVATAARAARRDDYALAAGPGDGPHGRGAIAGGVATVSWSAVPPGIFDSAEGTVDWAVVAAGPTVNAVVQAVVSGPDQPNGIPVALRCGGYRGAGVLDADGRAALSVLDDNGRPVTETQAWNLDWSVGEVTVGVPGATESVQTRDRVRTFARDRLAAAAPDAFLAEILAAESDY